MRFLASQQDLINSTISIGKCIGDAFAWFFYQRDRHYLAEHLVLPSQIHTPPGIGGAGELEFVKNVHVVNGYFVLYHGNTNILRLGDLTLIDLKSFRVAGIGELKSQSVESGKLNITLLFSGPQITLEPPNPHSEGSPTEVPRKNIGASLSPSGRARLNRQMKQISDSYRQLSALPDKKLNLEMEARINSVSKFIANLKASKFQFHQIGPGLLLVGYKGRKKSLYRRLTKSSSGSLNSKLEGVEKRVADLMATSRTDNAIITGSLFYDTKGKARHVPGMTHPVWWPVNHRIVKSLLFQDVIVLTLYNPVHLIASLEGAGFSVEETSPLTYRVTKLLGDKYFDIEGMSYYLTMIQQYFFTEEAIVSMLSQAEEQIDEFAGGAPARIELHIEQRFGRPG